MFRSDDDPDCGNGFEKLKYEAKREWYIEDLDEDKIAERVAEKGYVEFVKSEHPSWISIVLESVLRDYSQRYTRVWFNVNRGQFVTLTPIRSLDDDNDFNNFSQVL